MKSANPLADPVKVDRTLVPKSDTPLAALQQAPLLEAPENKVPDGSVLADIMTVAKRTLKAALAARKKQATAVIKAERESEPVKAAIAHHDEVMRAFLKETAEDYKKRYTGAAELLAEAWDIPCIMAVVADERHHTFTWGGWYNLELSRWVRNFTLDNCGDDIDITLDVRLLDKDGEDKEDDDEGELLVSREIRLEGCTINAEICRAREGILAVTETYTRAVLELEQIEKDEEAQPKRLKELDTQARVAHINARGGGDLLQQVMESCGAYLGVEGQQALMMTLPCLPVQKEP